MAAGCEYIVRNASTDQIDNLWFKNQKFNNKKKSNFLSGNKVSHVLYIRLISPTAIVLVS